MRHIAPVVRSILCSSRQLRAIKHKSIRTRSVQNLTKVVDPSLVRRVPIQVNGDILRYNSCAEGKWDYRSHVGVEVPTKHLNEGEDGAKESKNVQRNKARMAHDLYTGHQEDSPQSTAYAEGSGLMNVGMADHGDEMSGAATARVRS
jgi:hypothetical protein